MCSGISTNRICCRYFNCSMHNRQLRAVILQGEIIQGKSKICVVFPLATFTMAPRHALLSSAMPFFPAPCPFSKSTHNALLLVKKSSKSDNNLESYRSFSLKPVVTNKAAVVAIKSHMVDCLNPLSIVTK